MADLGAEHPRVLRRSAAVPANVKVLLAASSAGPHGATIQSLPCSQVVATYSITSAQVIGSPAAAVGRQCHGGF